MKEPYVILHPIELDSFIRAHAEAKGQKMIERRQIILTHLDAVNASKDGLDWGGCAARKFKEVHGLEFKVEEFNSEERFEYYESIDKQNFKIVFKEN